MSEEVKKLGSLTDEYQHETSEKRLLTSTEDRLTLGAFTDTYTDIRRQSLHYLGGQRPAINTCDLSLRRDHEATPPPDGADAPSRPPAPRSPRWSPPAAHLGQFLVHSGRRGRVVRPGHVVRRGVGFWPGSIRPEGQADLLDLGPQHGQGRRHLEPGAPGHPGAGAGPGRRRRGAHQAADRRQGRQPAGPRASRVPGAADARVEQLPGRHLKVRRQPEERLPGRQLEPGDARQQRAVRAATGRRPDGAVLPRRPVQEVRPYRPDHLGAVRRRCRRSCIPRPRAST